VLELDRPLKLLSAVVAVALTPLPALAQAWPATVVAGAPQMRSQPRTTGFSVQRDFIVLRPAGLPPTQPDRRRLKLATVEPRDVPEVAVPAKAEWSDDQGFRAGPTKLAFKRRF
jgi:hypothetical protein